MHSKGPGLSTPGGLSPFNQVAAPRGVNPQYSVNTLYQAE
jgi:hypothetical protein